MHNFTCPHCKAQFNLTPMDDHYHTPWQPVATFQNVSQGPLNQQAGPGGYGEWQKITPVGRLSARDVLTSLLDSTIVFTLISGATGLICHYAGLPWLVGPSVGLVVAGVRYIYGMSNTQGLLMIRETWRSEEPTPAGPGQGHQEHVIKVELRKGKDWEFAFLGIDPELLIPFAEAVLGGVSFAEKQAQKYGIPQKAFNQLKDEFIKRGLARWTARPGGGVTLQRSGYTVLKHIIDSKQQQAAGSEDE